MENISYSYSFGEPPDKPENLQSRHQRIIFRLEHMTRNITDEQEILE